MSPTLPRSLSEGKPLIKFGNKTFGGVPSSATINHPHYFAPRKMAAQVLNRSIPSKAPFGYQPAPHSIQTLYTNNGGVTNGGNYEKMTITDRKEVSSFSDSVKNETAVLGYQRQ
jgi:hypothetical protein